MRIIKQRFSEHLQDHDFQNRKIVSWSSQACFITNRTYNFYVKVMCSVTFSLTYMIFVFDLTLDSIFILKLLNSLWHNIRERVNTNIQ